MNDYSVLSWKPIRQFPMYGITAEGHVINLKTKKVKKHTIDHKGYPRVSLYINDKSHYKLVHRLLAETFIPNPDNKPIVHHINGDPADCNLANLVWVTHAENVQDGFDRGRKSWNKDMKSTANMTLEDLARELPRLQEIAKALWGEDTNRLWKCPACGYSFEYYKHNETQEYCPNDGRKVKDVTEPKPVWEQKWADRLQEMVIADDPLDYLKENI